MELYIGGCGQGKLSYVLAGHKEQDWKIIDGSEMPDTFLWDDNTKVLINHFHLWIKRLLENGRQPEQLAELLAEKYPSCIIICDEVGNGIVPVKQSERAYRERLGRILIDLASKAERVERVICGLGQRLK